MDLVSDQDLTFDTAAVDQIVHAVQASQKRGFSAAGRPDQRSDRVFFNFHVQIHQRLLFAIEQIQMVYLKNNVLHYATS